MSETERAIITKKSIYEIHYSSKTEALSALYRLFASPKCPCLMIDITLNAKRNGKTEHFKMEKDPEFSNISELTWDELIAMDSNIFEICCVCYPYIDNLELKDKTIRMSYFNIQTSNTEITVDTTKCDDIENFKKTVLDILT